MHKKQNQSVMYSLHTKITFNLNLVGRKATGKSSLAIREIKDTFGNVPGSSEGFEFYSKTVPKRTQEVLVQIWDTAGTSEYNSMTRNFFRKAAAIILVYDKFDGLQNEISNLKKQLNEYAHEAVKFCIVRTKIDSSPISEQEREKVKQLCESNKIDYQGQVSAKTNQNVHKYFSELIDMMFKCYEEDEDFREAVTPSKDSFLLNSVEPGQVSSIKAKKKKCC